MHICARHTVSFIRPCPHAPSAGYNAGKFVCIVLPRSCLPPRPHPCMRMCITARAPMPIIAAALPHNVPLCLSHHTHSCRHDNNNNNNNNNDVITAIAWLSCHRRPSLYGSARICTHSCTLTLTTLAPKGRTHR